jgi:hypothetical protein
MQTPMTINALHPIATAAALHHLPTTPPQLDVLMLSGFLLSILTLVIWLHPVKSRLHSFVFATAIAGLALFGFMQGAWPLGIVAIVWSAATLQRWHQGKDIVVAVNEARHRWLFSQLHRDNGSRNSRTYERN